MAQDAGTDSEHADTVIDLAIDLYEASDCAITFCLRLNPSLLHSTDLKGMLTLFVASKNEEEFSQDTAFKSAIISAYTSIIFSFDQSLSEDALQDSLQQSIQIHFPDKNLASIQFGLKREPLLGDLMLSMFETKGLPWFLNRLQSCLLDYTVVNRPRRVFCDCVLLYITFVISIITLLILSWAYLSDDKDPWILFVLLPYFCYIWLVFTFPFRPFASPFHSDLCIIAIVNRQTWLLALCFALGQVFPASYLSKLKGTPFYVTLSLAIFSFFSIWGLVYTISNKSHLHSNFVLASCLGLFSMYSFLLIHLWDFNSTFWCIALGCFCLIISCFIFFLSFLIFYPFSMQRYSSLLQWIIWTLLPIGFSCLDFAMYDEHI